MVGVLHSMQDSRITQRGMVVMDAVKMQMEREMQMVEMRCIRIAYGSMIVVGCRRGRRDKK
jgi:hypothetical protein